MHEKRNTKDACQSIQASISSHGVAITAGGKTRKRYERTHSKSLLPQRPKEIRPVACLRTRPQNEARPGFGPCRPPKPSAIRPCQIRQSCARQRPVNLGTDQGRTSRSNQHHVGRRNGENEMTIRERIADWISGGAVTFWCNRYAQSQMELGTSICHAWRLDHGLRLAVNALRDSMHCHDCTCGECDRIRDELDRIKEINQ